MTLAAVLAVGVGAAVAGCGDGDGDEQAAGVGQVDVGPVGPVELPFGLEQVDGTEPIGRPAVFDDAPYMYNGEPVSSRLLRAAYRVTADDPLAVVRAWADQLDGLALDEVQIVADHGGGAGPWVEVATDAAEDWADLQLWATGDGPVLLVSLARISEEPPRAPSVVDQTGSPPAPEPADLGATGRTAGDELFAEQGNVIHLPEGTTALMPTIPTMAGTGGSTSVVAAEDGEAAIRAMLDEAMERDADGRVDEPVVAERDGIEVITAGYVRDAGGWEFDVVSVRGPDDPTATLYVTSAAD